MGAIVRVLWGDDRPGCRWHKTAIEVQRTAMRKEQCPQHIYVYGQNNFDFVREWLPDATVKMVDPNPFPYGKPDYIGDDGVTRIPWYYKHALLAEAACDNGPVIYCDWDVRIECKSPEEPLSMLDGRQVALTAFYYRRPRPFQMPRVGNDRHINVSGAIIYAKTPWFPRAVFRKMENMRRPWHWHDEMAMNDLIDEVNSGWIGETEWLRKYENPTVVLGDRRSPWGASTIVEPDGDYERRRRTIPIVFDWVSMFKHY